VQPSCSRQRRAFSSCSPFFLSLDSSDGLPPPFFDHELFSPFFLLVPSARGTVISFYGLSCGSALPSFPKHLRLTIPQRSSRHPPRLKLDSIDAPLSYSSIDTALAKPSLRPQHLSPSPPFSGVPASFRILLKLTFFCNRLFGPSVALTRSSAIPWRERNFFFFLPCSPEHSSQVHNFSTPFFPRLNRVLALDLLVFCGLGVWVFSS